MASRDDDFERDPEDWLRRLSAPEWIRAALAEFERARAAVLAHQRARAVAGFKRAAGMSLNAVLLVDPKLDWGRTYVEHLHALVNEPRVPSEVVQAARLVLAAHVPASAVVALHTPSEDAGLADATQCVMAYAYATLERRRSKEESL